MFPHNDCTLSNGFCCRLLVIKYHRKQEMRKEMAMSVIHNSSWSEEYSVSWRWLIISKDICVNDELAY